MPDLIDIGVNLTHDSFEADREAVMAAARAEGVTRFIVTGTSITESARALEIARLHEGSVFSTAGIHPHHAKDFDEHSVGALRDLLRDDVVVAVGECGLDYCRNFSPREAQERAFAQQLALAAEIGKPVFLHQRDAEDAFLSMVGESRDALTGGVAHCFTGGVEALRSLLELDLYVGITGWLCDERRGGDLRETVAQLPLERVLVETDAPYLLPKDLPAKPRARRNEPRYLSHVLARLAQCMGQPVERLAEATTRNAERLFKLPAR